MKSLRLNVDEAVFHDLDIAIKQKRLNGKFSGVVDMLGLAVLESLKANQVERTLKYRKKDQIISAVGQ